MLRCLGFLLCLLWLPGCASSSTALDDDLVAEIHDGRTTRADVEKLFGPPKGENLGSNGKRVAVYHFKTAAVPRRAPARKSAAGPPTIFPFADKGSLRLRTLSVLYRSDGQVERHHLYEASTAVTASPQHSEVGTSVRPEKLSFIYKGLTDREDLVSLFGEPLVEALEPSGQLVLSWIHSRNFGWTGARARVQQLQVLMGPNGKVEDFHVAQPGGK